MVTHVGQKLFLGGQPLPHPKGKGAATIPEILGPPIYRPTGRNNQICVIKLDARKINFYAVDHEC